MLKTIVMITVVLSALFILVSCGSAPNENLDTEYNNAHSQFILPTVTIEEPSSFDRVRHGTEMIAEAGARRYQFPTADEAYNLTLALLFEDVVYMFNEFIDVDRRLPIVFTQDKTHYSVRGNLGESLVINPHDPATYGWFIYSITLGSIPMWLSAGMEMSVRGIDFDYPLSGLCDMYFAPFSWDTAEHRRAISTAYHFVKYLTDNNYLVEIVAKYMSGDRNRANLLAVEHFYSFSGYYLDTFLRLEFSGTSFNVTAGTNMSDYIFEFPQLRYQIEWPDMEIWGVKRLILDIDYMDKARLLRSIAFVEDAILFVKNWYAEFVDFDFVPITIHIPMVLNMFGWADDRQMKVDITGLASLAAHEISHVITNMLGWAPFAPFNEGLAETLQSKHKLFDMDGRGWEYQLWPVRVKMMVPALYEIGAFENYTVANAVIAFLIDDFERYYDFTHFLAYVALNIPEAAVFPQMRMWAVAHPEIQSYNTSSSFVRYLIGTHGAETYMQVHFDMSRFEYVYGITLEEMIQEWMIFINIYADELLLMAMQAYGN